MNKSTNEISNVVITSMTDRQFPIFLTNIAVGGLSECDVLGINKNNYIYEYEIKRSRNDYFADFRKVHKHHNLEKRNSHRYYDEYHNGKKTGGKRKVIHIPNRFFYTCEPNLISVDEIPEYAGLVYVEHSSLTVIKNAPLLHKEKPDEHMFRAIASTLSQRQFFGCSYMTYRNKLLQERNKLLLE